MNEPHTITTKIITTPRKTHCIPISPVSFILCCVSWPWSVGVEVFSLTPQAGAYDKKITVKLIFCSCSEERGISAAWAHLKILSSHSGNCVHFKGFVTDKVTRNKARTKWMCSALLCSRQPRSIAFSDKHWWVESPK